MMRSVSGDPVLGVDGYRGGWIGALVTGRRVRWLALPDAAAVLAVDAAAVGIDIPIGLPAGGTRACDRAARARLGRAGSAVFPAPVRGVLGAGSYRAACDISLAASGRMISRQVWHLLAKIAQVDDLVTAERQRRLVEVHPEVSFRALDDRVVDRKKTARGVGQRLRALTRVVEVGDLADVPPAVGLDDALDALAAAWTAARWRDGVAEVLPGVPPPRDARNLRMEIVV